ncbi:MAG TPA: ABC transporter ATP-binding protein [Spirochaetota bacterium]|nr:ABC transporter ATP-binding protein [Spirochaetota bacterium]HOM37703.1 ABC transporter ATP-binding protein [Spirochaetota bacterium]HPQ49661.1 ABC transporter ATP-binding protein [Spirochaetota bacterium]
MLKGFGISKTYKYHGFYKRVLDNIDIEIKEKSINLLIGKSGEGKTTLLKILARIIKPDSGTIFFNGKKLGFMDGFYRQNTGFIFQDFKLIPYLNVFENISLPIKIRGKYNKDWIFSVMEFIGIKDLYKKYPYMLSGGEAQRVGIARAVASGAKIIFADEPTGNLDKDTGKSVINLFKSIKDEFGITLVIVTHDDEFRQASDFIFELSNSKIRCLNV